MNASDVALKVLEVLSPALLAVLSWLSVKAAQLITAKVKNEYLRGILVRLDDAVMNAVREVEQVTVSAIKASSADGQLSADERAMVKQAAVSSIKSHLGSKGLAELAQVPRPRGRRPREGSLDPRRGRRSRSACGELERRCRERGPGGGPFRGVSDALDRAGSLTPGHGRVDLFASADERFVGGGVDFAHRLTPSLSAFAEGWAGWQNDAGAWRSGVGAMGGLRWQW